jgi:hypothetical protein
MQLLLAPQNWPFSVALGLVAALGALQIALALLGGALAVGADIDADVGVDTDGPFDAALDWLHVGKLPFTILLMLFGLCFGAGGIALQSLMRAQSGAFLSPGLAALFAFLLSLPLLRLSGMILRPLLPREESEAVSSDSFVGLQAQITLGTARRGQPAEAKVRDKWGKTHYISVEPQDENSSFAAGSLVLLLTKQGHVFRATEGVGDE